QEKFEKFWRRYEKNGSPKNLIPIHADAIHWLAHCALAESIARVFILYPNPELKNKNQRFSFMPFTAFLVSRLILGGELILATNIESYKDECLQEFPKLGLEFIEQPEIELPGRTHFERKYLARQEACYNLLFKRVR